MTGYRLDEIIGKTPRILQGPKTDPLKVSQIRKSLANRKPIQISLTNYRKDGSDYEVELDIVPVADENGCYTHSISIQRDVTERRKIEELIEEKNRLLKQSYDAIFIWNIDDGITYWHPNSTVLFGFSESEAVGRDAHSLLRTVFPKSFPEFVRDLRETGFWEGETVHVTKSKTEVIAESRLQVIRKTGENLLVLETLHDVTERRRIELNLARTSELALIGELAAGLAHEIKNPLAGVKGVIDIMIRDKHAGKHCDSEILESVRHEIDRIDKTVRALLQHSRPRPIEITPFPLDETIRRAVRLAAYKTSAGEVRRSAASMKLVLPEDGMIVPHDSGGLEDAILNLIINARDAIAGIEGGLIEIRLDVAESSAGTPEAVIDVCDNGCGIAEGRLAGIFTPFQSSKEDGTGLGLASVRRIVRAHGGECEIRSELGRGTTVTVHLPLGQTDADAL
jgi:PAS domain S-box-containing protein